MSSDPVIASNGRTNSEQQRRRDVTGPLDSTARDD